MLFSSDDELQIQLIDFEYGGYNYLCFDIANHFNEFAGGTQDAKPDYNLFPSLSEKRHFLSCYLKAKGGAYGDEELRNMMAEVDTFVLVNHLYWGLWAVNQAKSEGCGEFDYLLYAHNRFRQFNMQKTSANPPSNDKS
jgi:ethanolamine kinase